MCKKLWVAIPDSLVSDTKHLRSKTLKIGSIGRACSIFGVSRIYIYRDISGYYDDDFEIIKTVLEYMETPQYLRKRMFDRVKTLKYAGLLPPLRTPHHKLEVPLSEIRVGDFREGVLVKVRKKIFVDVGLSSLVEIENENKEGERVIVKFTSKFPNLKCIKAKNEEIKEYHGYRVKRVGTLDSFVKNAKADLTLFTSKKGEFISKVWQDLISKVKKSKTVLLIFGSPKKGIFEIISDCKSDLSSFQISRLTINTIPNQKTATVRTEEAILISLSILNIALHI